MGSETILDVDALQQITEGDRALEQALVKLYCSTADRCLLKLKEIAGNDRQEEWKKVVHELKGASVSIHAMQMAELCKYAEHEDDGAARLEVCDNLDSAYKIFQAFCANLLQ